MNEAVHNIVTHWETSRDYSKLPADFARDRVKWLVRELRPHFRGNSCIKARIMLGKAETFAELHAAIEARP